MHPSNPAPTLLLALESLDLGDRAVGDGDRPLALLHYGSALDLFLRQGLVAMAASVAQRMVRRCPDVVRARGTLAVLSLAESLRLPVAPALDSARADFEAYLRASLRSGQERLASEHLTRIAEATEDPLIREWMADYIALLGDPSGAEQVFVRAYEEREGIRAVRPANGDQTERWTEVLVDGPLALPHRLSEMSYPLTLTDLE